MNGQMMQMPLLISSLLLHAERHHPEQEVVTRAVEGGMHRESFRELADRSRRVANALTVLGIDRGDRVATLAWNTNRHMELYYGVSGSGAVLHTLNPRLHLDQLVWIIDHAEDKVLFFDLTFLPIVEAIAARVKTIRTFVVMTDGVHMPTNSEIAHLLCYEDLIAQCTDEYVWPTFDENSACSLCYTSGTTGNPKGVLYSHRSTVLHCYASALPDAFNCSALDVILPVVPMFHVNAWGLPYVACMTGAKLVFPGAGLDGKSLYKLIESEGVTSSAGVPTVWQGLLNHMEANQLAFSSMKRTLIGGSACPRRMLEVFEKNHDVRVLHAWGMTETSPMGTVMAYKPEHLARSQEERMTVLQKQGRVAFGVDMQIVDPDGKELPWDGVTAGELLVRGHWIMDRYYQQDAVNTVSNGWFVTGDIATISKDGLMKITDRSKDLIKSGGEWIGSIELENIAMSHPAVAAAACIAVYHPKWDERPLLIVVRKPGVDVEAEEILSFFDGKIAKWWTPDEVIFTDQIPIGATGKILKHKLREQYDVPYPFRTSGSIS